MYVAPFSVLPQSVQLLNFFSRSMVVLHVLGLGIFWYVDDGPGRFRTGSQGRDDPRLELWKVIDRVP
jgi:hypothetical protein